MRCRVAATAKCLTALNRRLPCPSIARMSPLRWFLLSTFQREALRRLVSPIDLSSGRCGNTRHCCCYSYSFAAGVGVATAAIIHHIVCARNRRCRGRVSCESATNARGRLQNESRCSRPPFEYALSQSNGCVDLELDCFECSTPRVIPLCRARMRWTRDSARHLQAPLNSSRPLNSTSPIHSLQSYHSISRHRCYKQTDKQIINNQSRGRGI